MILLFLKDMAFVSEERNFLFNRANVQIFLCSDVYFCLKLSFCHFFAKKRSKCFKIVVFTKKNSKTLFSFHEITNFASKAMLNSKNG
jgi:hypothetical protein